MQADDSNLQRLAVSPDRAAKMLGIGRSKLYELLRTQEIQTAHIGTRRVIPVANLERFLEGRIGASAAQASPRTPRD